MATAVQDAPRGTRLQGSPSGLGLRQSSGALAARVKWPTGETWFSSSLRSGRKAVEDYRSPRRFATPHAVGFFTACVHGCLLSVFSFASTAAISSKEGTCHNDVYGSGLRKE